MSYDSAFGSKGPTYLVGTTPVQVLANTNENPTSYRVRNLLATQQYFTWSAANQTTPASPPTITVTIPTAGVPSVQTIGMFGSTVETFSNIPANVWFQANAVGAFEITPGEGI